MWIEIFEKSSDKLSLVNTSRITYISKNTGNTVINFNEDDNYLSLDSESFYHDISSCFELNASSKQCEREDVGYVDFVTE